MLFSLFSVYGMKQAMFFNSHSFHMQVCEGLSGGEDD